MKRWALIAVGVVAIAAAVFYVNPYGALHPTHAPKRHSSADAIESFHLSNGIEVVLVPNHRIPAISHTIWIKAGAADDPIGKSGVAHYLEHLLFKGTPTHPAGEYDRIVESYGGQFNAFTGSDYTGFYVTIAKEHLEEVMALEADRMQHLHLTGDGFAKERKVIVEERKSRVDNQPRALLDEEVDAALFRRHPYGTPIIGWQHEMEKLSLQDAMAFYHRFYQPAHMVLVVAGDITRKELEPLAERYYGSIKKQAAQPRNWAQEPPQRAARFIRMRHALVQQPLWLRTYVAPSLVDGDDTRAFGLEVLAQWMGGGKTSLFYRELVVKQKLATAVNVSYSSFTRGPSQFTISVVPAQNVKMTDIRKAVDALLVQVRHQRMGAGDLERIKTLLKADAIYARDGLEPVAQMIGVLRVLDLDVGYFTQWPQRIEAVQADDVRGAAKDVLKPQQSVTAELLGDKAPVQGVEP